MAYADITIHDPNPIKRWLQRKRFSDAIGVLKKDRFCNRVRILDFGAGNGELVRQMAGMEVIDTFIFEPTPLLLAEAKENLKDSASVTFVENISSLESNIFDYIFCLEVFEHLPEKETDEAIAVIYRLLKPNGIAVIGVPHELFFPAILKGLFRMYRRYGDFDTKIGNILSAFCGLSTLKRPVAEISPGMFYHFHHLGFDYRKLEHKIQERLQLTEKWFSPFPILGAVLNSEVYFLLRKNPSVILTDTL